MKISRRRLALLNRPYSITLLPGLPGERGPAFAVGSELDDPLLLFASPEDPPRVLAERPGGFISLWPLVTGQHRWLVASVDFKPGFQAADARILLYSLDAGGRPEAVEVLRLPYTHRVATVERNGRHWFIGSTLCAGKDHRDDWSQPGGLHVAAVPDDPTQPWTARQVVQGLTKNHGLDRAWLSGREGFLVSAAEGLFFMPLPGALDGDWGLERLAASGCSDAFACPGDGPGASWVFALSPFHGHRLSRLKVPAEKTGALGVAEIIAEDLDFGHVVWAGTLLGAPAVLAGCRGRARDLRLYRPTSQPPRQWDCTTIDEGIGAAQMAVVIRGPRRATLLVTAHALGEVLAYELEG